MRLIERLENGHRSTKTFRDAETGEFQVRLYEGGALREGATYFTDDREDAHATARYMLTEPGC